MNRKTRNAKRKNIILIAAAVLALVVGVIVVILVNQDKKSDNDASKQGNETSTNRGDEPAKTEDPEPAEKNEDESKPANEDDSIEIDPTTLATVDIEPANIKVSYIKGAGGFEYEVLRSKDGRKYVELRSPDLIGTKCEDDNGVFVSILESPNDSESATVSKRVTVDGTEYGLSVASATCTSKPEALAKYQDSFTKAFKLLQKLN